MRKILLLACIAACLIACKPAKNSSAPPVVQAFPAATTAPPPATTAAPARHFLWRVSRGHQSLYLVGSLHALNPDDYPLAEVMENAFRHSYALVEEINLTNTDTAAMQKLALRMGAYPRGKSLRNQLPPEVYAKISQQAQKLGIDMQRLDLLRPWLGSIAILDMQLKQAGYSASAGVDHHFADEAQMANKHIIGLETPRFQLHLLAELPPKVQQDMLLQSLEQAKDFDLDMQHLINAWEKGDTHALQGILEHDFGKYPMAYKLLIADRNRAWMPRLLRMLRSGRRYFVVVGALHMVGTEGLLARFEKAGYRVEQL
ncbi:MAG: TraB/GumN family protein [Gammaproteobacteria bacterium]|nr:TraB/GumN family protein [Gammaproteobacteria bacterium]